MFIYALCFGTMLDYGEANFLRVPIDPLFVSVAVLSVFNYLSPKFKWLKFFADDESN
jgi:hypothetical protein